MKRELLHNDDIFVIHDFLTMEECERFIASTEAVGYGDAPITTSRGPVMRKDVRDNDRVMIDDPATAAELFARARPFLPDRFMLWEPCGFNERFRFYRYTKGQKFDWHFDGAFHRPDGEVSSKFTFMIYLNGGTVGGETKFKLRRLGSVAETGDVLSVVPWPGKALVFRHDVLHTGAMVLDGVKYVMRTDVMHRRVAE